MLPSPILISLLWSVPYDVTKPVVHYHNRNSQYPVSCPPKLSVTLNLRCTERLTINFDLLLTLSTQVLQRVQNPNPVAYQPYFIRLYLLSFPQTLVNNEILKKVW